MIRLIVTIFLLWAGASTAHSITLNDGGTTGLIVPAEPSVAHTYRIVGTATPTPSPPVLHNDARWYDRLRITFDVPDPSVRFAVLLSDDGGATWCIIDATAHCTDTEMTVHHFHSATFWNNGDAILYGLQSNHSYRARLIAYTHTGGASAPATSAAVVKTDVPYVSLSLSQHQHDVFILNTQRIARARRIIATIGTNSPGGYNVYLRGSGNGTHGGLYNATSKTLIPSQDGVLVAGVDGYGVQVRSEHARVLPPYNGTGTVVGAVPIVPVRVATYERDIARDTLTIIPHVSISGRTDAGTYTDIIYYTVTPSL